MGCPPIWMAEFLGFEVTSFKLICIHDEGIGFARQLKKIMVRYPAVYSLDIKTIRAGR
jgi:hypothetical protein